MGPVRPRRRRARPRGTRISSRSSRRFGAERSNRDGAGRSTSRPRRCRRSFPLGPRVDAAYGYTGRGVGPTRLLGEILAARALGHSDDRTRLPLVGRPRGTVPAGADAVARARPWFARRSSARTTTRRLAGRRTRSRASSPTCRAGSGSRSDADRAPTAGGDWARTPTAMLQRDAGDGHLRRQLRHGRQAADRPAEDRRLQQVPPDLDRASGGGGDPHEAAGREHPAADDARPPRRHARRARGQVHAGRR